MCCKDKENEETKERKNNYRNADYSDPNYEGEPTDPALSEGPYEQRSCTDICCCLIFIAYCVGMGYVAQQGFSNSHPERLLDAYDSTGKILIVMVLFI